MEKNANLLISVIVPVYNRSRDLNRTLASIANQTVRPLELILVDNASTDDSLELCNKFKADNQNETLNILVMTELKPGANAARNKGLKAANGDYLYFFDSDDLLYPHSLETVYRHLYKNGFPELIAFPFILRYPDGKTSRRPHRYSVDPASQLFDMVIPTHGVCFKRSFVEKTGLWDNHLFRWQDLEFGFRLLLHAEKLVWIKEAPLYEVRVHPDSISGKTFTEDHALLHATLAKIQRIIDQLPPGKSTERMQRALCFKTVSMASQIKLEKSRTLSKHYLAEAIDKLPTARYKTSRCLLKIHYFYSGMGGRGFWRLAEKWL